MLSIYSFFFYGWNTQQGSKFGKWPLNYSELLRYSSTAFLKIYMASFRKQVEEEYGGQFK